MCERERERERECVSESVCVCERERGSACVGGMEERERTWLTQNSLEA